MTNTVGFSLGNFSICVHFFSGIRNHLMDSADEQCPKCTESNVNMGNLIPNRYLRKKCLEFDRKTGGRYVTKFEQRMRIKSPTPTPLPPHLRTSNNPTPAASPPQAESNAKAASPDININKDPSVKEGKSSSIQESSLSNGNESAAKVSDPSSPKSSEVEPIKLQPDEGEKVDLYRGLLKDVEESEMTSRKMEEERSRKSKKAKKEKKKKDGSKDKEKKKKHRRSSKSSKSPRLEPHPPGSTPVKGASDENALTSPVAINSRRSVSSDSSSSDGSAKDKKALDTSHDLFSVALNVPPYHPSQGYPGSTSFYPPPPVQFQVPPPGYPAPPLAYQTAIPVTETIDDPLAAFQKHLREKDERRRMQQHRRHRSPSYGRSHSHRRSWSRSRSHSQGRHYKNANSPPGSYGGRRYRRSRSRSPHHGHYGSPRSRSRQYSPPRSGRIHGSPPSRRSPYRRSPGHYKDRRVVSRSRLVISSLLLFHCTLQSLVSKATKLTINFFSLGFGNKFLQRTIISIIIHFFVQSSQFFNKAAGVAGSSHLPPD